MELTSPQAVATALESTGYLADDDLATVVYLAQGMQRPLLLEGEPGTGKTALAEALAAAGGRAADPAAVLRGDRRQPGALRLGLPAPDPAPAHARGGDQGRRARPQRGREVAVRRAVPARPAGAAGAARGAGGAARRRGGPGRRRVRGVPARGALELVREHPRARHGHRGDAADRGAHLQPHPRAARRPQASLPLPLDRPPRPRARGGDRAQPAARGQPAAGRAGGRPGAAAAGRAAAQAARVSPRRWTGRGRCTGSASRSSTSRPRPARSARW